MSSTYTNKLDNSDLPIVNNSQTVVGGLYDNFEEAKQMNVYLENLQLISGSN